MYSRIADSGALTAAAAASVSWYAHANEVLQLVATVIAIAAGLASLWYHIKRIRKD